MVIWLHHAHARMYARMHMRARALSPPPIPPVYPSPMSPVYVCSLSNLLSFLQHFHGLLSGGHSRYTPAELGVAASAVMVSIVADTGTAHERALQAVYGDSYQGAVSCSSLVTGTTTGAHNHLGNEAPDHFYTFEVITAGRLTFDSCGSAYDTWLRVYDSEHRQVASCDDCGPCDFQTVLDTPVLQPGSYTLLIEGFASRSGAYTVTMRANGAPDACNVAVNTVASIQATEIEADGRPLGYTNVVIGQLPLELGASSNCHDVPAIARINRLDRTEHHTHPMAMNARVGSAEDCKRLCAQRSRLCHGVTFFTAGSFGDANCFLVAEPFSTGPWVPGTTQCVRADAQLRPEVLRDTLGEYLCRGCFPEASRNGTQMLQEQWNGCCSSGQCDFQPTEVPTSFPTQGPTMVPSAIPSRAPTATPTTLPTSSGPTGAPTVSASPTVAPTSLPSTARPSAVPSRPSPSDAPSSTTPTATSAPSKGPTLTSPPTIPSNVLVDPMFDGCGHLRVPGTCFAAVAVAYGDCSAEGPENCSRDPADSGSGADSGDSGADSSGSSTPFVCDSCGLAACRDPTAYFDCAAAEEALIAVQTTGDRCGLLVVHRLLAIDDCACSHCGHARGQNASVATVPPTASPAAWSMPTVAPSAVPSISAPTRSPTTVPSRGPSQVPSRNPTTFCESLTDELGEESCGSIASHCCDVGTAGAAVRGVLCRATCCATQCVYEPSGTPTPHPSDVGDTPAPTRPPSSAPTTMPPLFYIFCDELATSVGCNADLLAESDGNVRLPKCDYACDSPCGPNPCENGGGCFVSINSTVDAECECPAGYSGDVCEIDPCLAAPGFCLNGGRCTVDLGEPGCDCSWTPSGLYTGDHCELSPCEPNPCQHNGTCSLDEGGNPVCNCTFPFAGTWCDAEFSLEHYAVSQPYFDAHAPWSGKAVSQSQVIRRLPGQGIADCKHRCAIDPRCMGLTYFSAPAWFATAPGPSDGALDPLPYFHSVSDSPGYERGDCSLFSQPLLSDRWLELTENCIGTEPAIHLNVGVGPERLTDGLYQPWAAETADYLAHNIHQTCPEVDEVVVPLVAPSRVHAVRVWRRCDDPAALASPLQVAYGAPLANATLTNDSSAPAGDAALIWTTCGQPSTPAELRCTAGAAPSEQFWERQCDGDATAATAIRISRASILPGRGSPVQSGFDRDLQAQSMCTDEASTLPSASVELGCIVGDPVACNAAGLVFEGHRCAGADAGQCGNIDGYYVGPTPCENASVLLRELQLFANGSLCEPSPATLWSEVASTCCQPGAARGSFFAGAFCAPEDHGYRQRPMIAIPELEVYGNPARRAPPAVVRVNFTHPPTNLTAWLEQIL